MQAQGKDQDALRFIMAMVLLRVGVFSSYAVAVNALIDVKPLGGGGGGKRSGIGGGFDVTSPPMVGTFDRLLSSFDQP